ncbi:receptor like protein 23-like [Macadamia integrifolia]|uniref:receptor like protein 23-like n=1 Tax=Macadamia integrifolia TaxID=60698 RepID=UPI001C52E475|nr:receptor like protein 23-like [Macadamia integrifolia]
MALQVLVYILLLGSSLRLQSVTGRKIVGNKTDRLALLDFKKQIYDPFGVLISWNDSIHFCHWVGITCGHRHQQRVIGLDLEGKDLGGIISPSIGNFTFLHSLNIANNSFHGKIPQEIGNLVRLQYIDFTNNTIEGELPTNLANCTRLREILFSYKNFVGNIPVELFTSLSKLEIISIKYNGLTGEIPASFENISSIQVITLCDNGLQGSIPESLGQLTNLMCLSLCLNKLSGMFPVSLSNLSFLQVISLGENELHGSIPESLVHLTNLYYLSVYQNKLSRMVPVSLYNLSSLEVISLGQNQFHDNLPRDIGLTLNPNLKVLQIGSNFFSGRISDLFSLVSAPSLNYVDLSHNQFNGMLDDFSHNNKLVGKIPNSTYNGTNLEVLDLSCNKLSGVVPKCFGCVVIGNLSILNLEWKNLHGPIPDAYTEGCKLQIVQVNGNQLEGTLPRSLENCKDMEVLDVGNNQLSCTFPFWLENLPQLCRLVLKSNKFYGPIIQKSKAVDSHSPFPMLHVFDISLNSFTGKLPLEYICQWKSMLVTYIPQLVNYIGSDSGYQVTLEIVIKGISLEMKKVIETFTTINLSYNKFRGIISVAIGELKALMGLNLSSNDLIGQIPSSLAQLIWLESLDLSRNSLSGEIPQQLGSLTFLEVLNLSQNHLIGMILQGNQFGTFSIASYEGNEGLCGFPLPKRCGVLERAPLTPALTLEKQEEDFTSILDWRFVIAGYCSEVIIGMVIGQTMFWWIIGCFNLTSRMKKFKPKQRSKKSKRHGRVK